MAFVGYLPRLKRGLGIASGAYFLHDVLIQMFFIQYSINGQSFKVIKFLFKQLMTSQIYLSSTSKAMADREKKRRRQKYKN